MYDVLLRGGWVADGTGAPPARADVAVDGERIVAIGRLDAAHAGAELDVTGRYVLPGFIDAHHHADAVADSEPVQLAALRQGVTTLVLGQDGLSFAPASAATIAAVSRYFAAVDGPCPAPLAGGCTVAELLAHYDRAGALNVAYLAPAGTIRLEVMGYASGAADREQLAAMRGLVEGALGDGAVGLSAGLEYVPGSHADAAELAALCAPVAGAGGVFAVHMRGYEAHAWRGLDEVAGIARECGVAVHVSHLHGPANMITTILDAKRRDGIDLTFDSYPYLRGSTTVAMVALPAALQSAGPDETLARLADPAERARLEREWFPTVADVLGRITLSYIDAPEWAWTQGLALPVAAERAGMTAGALVCELVAASRLGAGCVFGQPPTNTERDVRALLRHEAHMAGSDAIMLGTRPHPRGWGTFARYLARHTRELGDWTWGGAALHLAGHPARRFGLRGRGLVRDGFVADLAVIDPVAVADRASYTDPRRPADGVDHVLVGGQFVLRDGALTGARPGRGLRRG